MYKRGPKVVQLIDAESGAVLREYATATQAAEHLSISNSSIGRACNGQIPDVDGYVFRFKARLSIAWLFGQRSS